MKYYLLAGAVLFIAIGAYFATHMSGPTDPHSEWRRTAMEKETKERPARFEEMKFHPVEVRMPASNDPKKDE